MFSNLNKIQNRIFSQWKITMAVRVNEMCIGMCDKHRMTLDFNETHVINQQLAEKNVLLVNIEFVFFFLVFSGFLDRFDLVAFFWWFISIFHVEEQNKIEVNRRNMNEEDRMKMCCISSRNIIKIRNKHYSIVFTEPKSNWYVTKQNDWNERERK